jgi:hypothetical protein
MTRLKNKRNQGMRGIRRRHQRYAKGARMDETGPRVVPEPGEPGYYPPAPEPDQRRDANHTSGPTTRAV